MAAVARFLWLLYLCHGAVCFPLIGFSDMFLFLLGCFSCGYHRLCVFLFYMSESGFLCQSGFVLLDFAVYFFSAL